MKKCVFLREKKKKKKKNPPPFSIFLITSYHVVFSLAYHFSHFLITSVHNCPWPTLPRLVTILDQNLNSAIYVYKNQRTKKCDFVFSGRESMCKNKNAAIDVRKPRSELGLLPFPIRWVMGYIYLCPLPKALTH